MLCAQISLANEIFILWNVTRAFHNRLERAESILEALCRQNRNKTSKTATTFTIP